MATQAEIEVVHAKLIELGVCTTEAVDREAVQAALEAAERARWQPIETAKHEPFKPLNLWVEHSESGGRLAQSAYWNDGWKDNGGNMLDFQFEEKGSPHITITSRVTHWQPIPSPPEST